MAALIEPPSLQFDIWDQMDSATMELALTSEFWSQVQTEVDTLDILPPPDMPDITPTEIDRDWSIIDILEEPAKENIVHHDCMWAGLCDDSVHPGNTFVPTEHITASPGQSLLRNSTQSPPRPETPPSLDGDEHPPFRHAVDVAVTARKLLRDVVADHSYTLARQNCDGLGVQTPSDSCESSDHEKDYILNDDSLMDVSPDSGINADCDNTIQKNSSEDSSKNGDESEEEIDVVSLEACQQTLGAPQHMRSNSLPRAPSAQERQMFQRTVASAITTRSRPVARKRLVPPTNIATGGVRKRRGPGRRGRKSNTDTESEGDCPETERRSIHNDMERLRRIGLKNLFDELKQQVPATRDKERAPKVVILREAAALCRRLRAEELQRSTLMKEQVKLMAKLKKLRAQSARHRLQ